MITGAPLGLDAALRPSEEGTRLNVRRTRAPRKPLSSPMLDISGGDAEFSPNDVGRSPLHRPNGGLSCECAAFADDARSCREGLAMLGYILAGLALGAIYAIASASLV